MPSAMAQAMPPASITIVNGQRVYQSTHLGTILNDTDQPISFMVTASLVDNFGNATPQPTIQDTASPQSTHTANPITCSFPVSNYSSGTQVTFIASTTVTGSDGSTSTDQQSNMQTVP